MAVYTRKELLEAVVSALSPMLIPGGGKVRAVFISEDVKPEELLKKAPAFPALAVTFLSSSCGPGPYRAYVERMEFSVTAVSRRGISPDPLTLLEDVRTHLLGRNLDVGTYPAKLDGETAVSVKDGIEYAAGNYYLVRYVSLED